MVVAGGMESMSLIPMGGHQFSPNPTLLERYPDSYLGMGLTAELVAKKYGIDREAADRFSLASHQKALAAIDAREVQGRDRAAPARDETGPSPSTKGRARTRASRPWPSSSPAFAAGGIVTAGNASQMSDGAAATVVMSAAKAKELGLKPLARFVSYAVAGVPPEIMGIGPVEAIPKALKQAGLKLADIDLIELNEAFACQALAVIQAAGLDPDEGQRQRRGGRPRPSRSAAPAPS